MSGSDGIQNQRVVKKKIVAGPKKQGKRTVGKMLLASGMRITSKSLPVKSTTTASVAKLPYLEWLEAVDKEELDAAILDLIAAQEASQHSSFGPDYVMSESDSDSFSDSN